MVWANKGRTGYGESDDSDTDSEEEGRLIEYLTM